MSATIIPLHRPNARSPRARLERAIALSVELRALLAPGFDVAPDLIEGMGNRLAAEEVRLRSMLAVVTSGPEVA